MKTRGGYPVEILTMNANLANDGQIVAIVTTNKGRSIRTYTANGIYRGAVEGNYDLDLKQIEQTGTEPHSG